MKLGPLDLNIMSSPALEPGQMLVHSAGKIYGWDLAKDGGDCCVIAERLPNGDIKIIEVTQSGPEPRLEEKGE